MTVEQLAKSIANQPLTSTVTYRVGRAEITADLNDESIARTWPRMAMEVKTIAESASKHEFVEFGHPWIGQLWITAFGDRGEKCGRLTALLLKYPEDTFRFPNSPTCKAVRYIQHYAMALAFLAIKKPICVSELIKNN